MRAQAGPRVTGAGGKTEAQDPLKMEVIWETDMEF